ncbi:MAG TPA: cupredoxin domain-containing protein [Candidatus Saccharimonadales bacterium]|nr:cupredoxin domain-containing protein [Candidatus Saccharimonadales bacterium]
MKKSGVIIAVLVVVVLAGGAFYLAKHSYKKSGSSTAGTNMNNSSSSASSTPTATNSVAIQGFAFSPTAITVKKGTTVTWTNKDSTAHTVTETDGQKGPNSGDLAQGAKYTFTFDTAGTFHYHCAIHSEMTGTVTVTE